jgi:5-methylcytosine-specific restriction endonuclease McrA
MSRLKFEYLCKKTGQLSQWDFPCEGCLRSCQYLTKVSPGRGIFGAVRQAILDRDKMCLACGTTEHLTIDHIVPISMGGSNEATNLQTLCKKCNEKKGSCIVDYRNPPLR